MSNTEQWRVTRCEPGTSAVSTRERRPPARAYGNRLSTLRRTWVARCKVLQYVGSTLAWGVDEY